MYIICTPFSYLVHKEKCPMNYVTIIVDYMSYNIPENAIPINQTDREKSFLSHYQYMVRDDYGATYHFGSKTTDKTKVVYTGESCARLFGEISTSEHIEMMLASGATFTRLDIALTEYLVDEYPYTVERIRRAVSKGRVDSFHAKYGAKVIADATLSPETLVIGDWKKRGKRGIVRCYDKSLEQGWGRLLVTRTEIEDKREKAHVSARRIANGEKLASVMTARFNIKETRFQRMLSGAKPSIMRPKSRESSERTAYEDESFKAWSWIMSTVAPTLGKTIALDHKNGIDNEQRQAEFWSVVMENYDKYISG